MRTKIHLAQFALALASAGCGGPSGDGGRGGSQDDTMPLSLDDLTVEAVDSRPFDCPDCGKASLTVSGLVRASGATVATFYVQWTPGDRTHDAYFDLVLGPWGAGTGPADRQAVTLALRHLETGPSFMVVDSAGRAHADKSSAGMALRREDVIGQPIAQRAFVIVDAIWLQDRRIEELTHP